MSEKFTQVPKVQHQLDAEASWLKPCGITQVEEPHAAPTALVIEGVVVANKRKRMEEELRGSEKRVWKGKSGEEFAGIKSRKESGRLERKALGKKEKGNTALKG